MSKRPGSAARVCLRGGISSLEGDVGGAPLGGVSPSEGTDRGTGLKVGAVECEELNDGGVTSLRALTACAGDSVKLNDLLSSSDTVRNLQGHKDEALSVSPDPELLVSGTTGGPCSGMSPSPDARASGSRSPDGLS